MILMILALLGSAQILLAEEAPSSQASAESSAPTGTSPATETSSAPSALDSYINMRDPFRRPQLAIAKSGPKGDLETYPADAFKYIGILTGPAKVRAMILDPSNKTHFVAEKTKIGLRGGVIIKITPEAIKIREKFVNLVGQTENIDMELRLPEAGSAKKSATVEAGGAVQASQSSEQNPGANPGGM